MLAFSTYQKNRGPMAKKASTIPLQINRATVLVGKGADRVMLYTAFAPPFPALSDQALVLGFDCTQGTGAIYCKSTFGIQPTVVKLT